MTQSLLRDRRRLIVPPPILYTDQVEQRTRNWLYDSISDTWEDVSANAHDTISRTNYGPTYYNTIEWLQLRIPGNSLVASKTPSLIKLKIKVYAGQTDASSTVSISANETYRKMSGLTFTGFGSFPASGALTDLNITSLCALIDKASDWYLQLQLNLVGVTTNDSISLHTQTDGSYIPYLALTY